LACLRRLVLYLTEDLQIEPRDTTWNGLYSLIFIDNPVGAGYSYTETDEGWARNTRVDVARDLFNLIQAFYVTFPDQKKVDLYITGESYAGHYIPAFGAYIFNQNQKGAKIPLKGVSIGDGWTDPVTQMTATPNLLFNLGLAANPLEVDSLWDYTNRTVDAINNGNYTLAFEIWDEMLNGDIWPYPTLFYNITGSMNYDNFLMTQSPVSFGYYSKYVTQDSVRKAIHVGNATFNSGLQCEMHLINDVMDSYKEELVTVMNNYNVLLYNGQLDLIVGAALTETMLPTVQWNRAKEFASARKKVWKVDERDIEVAGYIRSVQNLTVAVVRLAGHIVPYDQGRSMLDLLNRWIAGGTL